MANSTRKLRDIVHLEKCQALLTALKVNSRSAALASFITTFSHSLPPNTNSSPQVVGALPAYAHNPALLQRGRNRCVCVCARAIHVRIKN